MQAQSSVTLSGTIDAGLEKVSGSPLQLQNSRNGTTQITVSGVEDLGGGLKARFQISTSFDSSLDNATSTGRSGTGYPQLEANSSIIGNNGMFLALDSGVGSLILGRPLNTLYSHSYSANGTKGVTGFAATNTFSTSGIYTSNAIQYVTPNFAGFQAQFEFAPSEQQNFKSTKSVGLKYASGPFGVSFVRDYARTSVFTGTGAINTSNQYASKITQLAGFWDFGVAKLSATYQDNSLSASNADTAYVFGVNVPVGPGQFWAQYGVKELAATDAKIFGLGYKYSLSKRTTIYVNAGKRNDAATAAGGANAGALAVNSYAGIQAFNTGNTGYGLGIQHNF